MLLPPVREPMTAMAFKARKQFGKTPISILRIDQEKPRRRSWRDEFRSRPL
jgi:hypothetical protein